MEKLRFYAEHPEKFEEADDEFLKWCLEQEDFPDQYRFYARNELNRREHGRALIAVPKENPDGSPMTREDGQPLVDFVYTKGNWDKCKSPEVLCFYPSPKSTHFALNAFSDLLEKGEIPEPSILPQMVHDLFKTGLPTFYMLLTPEQRELAQKDYVCQLDDDVPVVHLLIPAPNGDIQMQWVPDGMRPFDVDPKPMSSAFWVEMLEKVGQQMDEEMAPPPPPEPSTSKFDPSMVDGSEYNDGFDMDAFEDKVKKKIDAFGTYPEMWGYTLDFMIRSTKNNLGLIKKGVFVDEVGEPALKRGAEIYHQLLAAITELMDSQINCSVTDLEVNGEFHKIHKVLSDNSNNVQDYLVKQCLVASTMIDHSASFFDVSINKLEGERNFFNKKEKDGEIEYLRESQEAVRGLYDLFYQALCAWNCDTSDYE